MARNGAAILLVMFLCVGPAWAQIEVLDSANLSANLTQIVRLVEEIRLTNEQLQDMLKNSQLGGASYTSIVQQLMTLGNLMQRGQAIGYRVGNIDERMLTTFPGYVSPKDWNQSYGTWTATSLDTLRNLLYSLGVNADQLAWDASRVQALAGMNAAALGRNNAIQVGNSIGLEAINWLQKIQTIAELQSNAYAVVESNKINKDAQNEAKTRQYLLNSARPIPAYGSSGMGVSTFGH